MIPRILVPQGARPPARDEVSTRRRPTTLDERTLVPSGLPLVHLDGKSTIPANLPLDSIATRVVVPRDVNVEAVQREEESTLPLQPTDLDERITIPQGVVPPAEFTPLPPISGELVEPDIIQTGEVTFLPPGHSVERTLGEKFNSITSVAMHIVLVLLLIFEPKIFGPHVPSREQEEIARRQMTVLLPPGALDSLKPSPRPAPHAPVSVDPRVIRRIAPPIQPPEPAPMQPEQPKKELPSAPVPKLNTVAPPVPESGAKGDLPKAPLKLESPDMPVPSSGLILPKETSPGGAIRDAARQSARINTPVPIGGGSPGGSGRGGGGGGKGSAGGAIQILSDTEGVDFNDYLHRIYYIVKANWFAVMPASVQLGDSGEVSLVFKIYQNGSVTENDPQLYYSSGKEPLDRAAVSSIRSSNPFPPLPPQFKSPYIELRYTYCYNETACPVGR